MVAQKNVKTIKETGDASCMSSASTTDAREKFSLKLCRVSRDVMATDFLILNFESKIVNY